MLIGIDASRAYTEENTGTENYSKELIESILALPEAKKHQFRFYLRRLKTSCLSLKKQWLKVIPWRRLWTQGGLAWELRRNPVDVLWIPAHTLPVIRPRQIKTVVTIHGLEYEYLPQYYQFPQKLWLNKSTEYAVKQADRLISVSDWTKQQLVERLGADKDKITVIHEGVNPRFIGRRFSAEYLRQIKYKYSLPDKYILFVGTIQPRKNLLRLIEAFDLVKSRDLYLVIAGKKGWMYEEILAAAKRKQVKFIGRAADEDLAAIYHSSRLFIYPSLMEGFGLPILEAMALGIPVITSDRGALPEVAGEAALIVNPEKTEEISGAIKLLIENEDLRQVLIERGYRRVKEFSWEKAAEATLEVLTKKW